MARSITVDFIGNDRSLGKTASSVDGKMSALGGKLKTFGKFAAAGLAVAGVAAVKFGIDAIGSASDLNETLSKSEAIFGRQAPAMEKWASGAARSAGLSKAAALGAAAGFGDMFSQIGFAGKQAASMSKDVVQMSADLGSFNNLETADVADRMSAAFRGEYDSLQALIPNINAARVEQQALATTGKKSASALTAQEKAAAVLAIVHKDGSKAMGDFERTSGGLANQQKILKAQFENVQASIGQKLLPVAVKLATFANETLLPGMTRLGNWMRDNLGPIFDRVGQIFSRVTGSMSGDSSKTVSQITGVLGDLKSIFQSTVSIIQSLWQRFGGMLTTFTKGTFKNLFQVISGAFEIIRGVFKVFSSLLKGDWKGVWDGIKSILKGAWKVIGGLVKQALNVLKTILKAGWSVLKSLTKVAWDGIKKLPGLALKGILSLVKSYLGLYKTAFRAGWDAIKGLARAAWDGIKSIVSGGADRLLDIVRSIPGRLRGLIGSFGSAGRAIIGAFVDGLKGAGGVVSDIAGNVWGAVKSLINSAIGKINAALSFHIGLPGPDVNVNVDIPYLAKGGIVRARRGGTLALLGEGGHDEAVIPLSGPHAPKRSRSSSEPDLRPLIVQLVVGGKVLEQVLIKHTRDTGRPLQVRTLGA